MSFKKDIEQLIEEQKSDLLCDYSIRDTHQGIVVMDYYNALLNEIEDKGLVYDIYHGCARDDV